jgi:hypothetical protein
VATNFALFSGKCCVLALYHRIFGQRLRYQIYSVAALSLAIPVTSVVVLGICVPRLGKQRRTVEADAQTLRLCTMITSVLSLTLDLLILSIPIPIILKLKLSRSKKTGVLAIFLTGLL